MLCICPSTCFRRRKKTRLKKTTCPHRFNKETRKSRPQHPEHFVMADQSSSLLTKSKKRVSIAPNPVPCTSTDFRGNPAVATTVFLQHEQEKKPTIPTIEIPDFADFNITDKARMIKEDSLIELQNLELSSLEVSSVSSHESDSVTIIEATEAPSNSKAPPSKLKRARQPKLSTCVATSSECAACDVTETCLSTTVDDRPEPKSGSHSGIVLSPSKLGQ